MSENNKNENLDNNTEISPVKKNYKSSGNSCSKLRGLIKKKFTNTKT